MKEFYKNNLSRYLLIPILFLLTSATVIKAQGVVISADPAYGSMDITNLSDVSVPADELIQGQVYKLKISVQNLALDASNYIPPSASVPTQVTMYFDIGLGTKILLDPDFNIATAPYNNFFDFVYITGSQAKIRCYVTQPVPADFDGTLVFDIQANTIGNSTLTGNVAVPNSSPDWIFSDQNPNNNTISLGYTIASGPLPVTITGFSATNKDCSIYVDWSVTQEINLKNYELEVSKDGNIFVTKAIVNAQNKLRYTTSFPIDEQWKFPTLLIRLKSIDMDGNYRYSRIVSVVGACSPPDIRQEIYCYPNPVIGNNFITIASNGEAFNGRYHVSIIDANGKNYINNNINIINVFFFKYGLGTQFRAGNYFILLSRTDGTIIKILPFIKF